MSINDASLKQFIFLQISSRLNAPRSVLFAFKQKENFRSGLGMIKFLELSDRCLDETNHPRLLIGRADFCHISICILIRPSLRTNENKTDIDLCVFEWV